VTATTTTTRDARLDAALTRFADRRETGHVLARLEADDGTWTWSGATGTTGHGAHDPITTATPYFVASVTKLYTATVILQLVEEGHVRLDQPVAELVPLSLAGLHVLHGTDHADAITVRHLLSHTSGLPDHLEDHPRGQHSWYRDLLDGRDRSWTLEEAVRRCRDDLRPRFVPQAPDARRQRARYSDLGFQLLIAAIEHVEGRPFGAVLERRLLRPLGLRHTWLPGHTAPLDPAPLPALVHDRRRPVHLPQALTAANDLVSTLDDSSRFLAAWSTGEVFTDPGTADLVRARWNRIGYPLRYGLGAMRFPVNPLAAPGRRTVHLVGHSGATGSWAFHCPELGILTTGTVDQIRGRTLPYRLVITLLRAAFGRAAA
jgi:D-alanyl-D-alanine carboxypeptidase